MFSASRPVWDPTASSCPARHGLLKSHWQFPHFEKWFAHMLVSWIRATPSHHPKKIVGHFPDQKPSNTIQLWGYPRDYGNHCMDVHFVRGFPSMERMAPEGSDSHLRRYWNWLRWRWNPCVLLEQIWLVAEKQPEKTLGDNKTYVKKTYMFLDSNLFFSG